LERARQLKENQEHERLEKLKQEERERNMQKEIKRKREEAAERERVAHSKMLEGIAFKASQCASLFDAMQETMTTGNPVTLSTSSPSSEKCENCEKPQLKTEKESLEFERRLMLNNRFREIFGDAGVPDILLNNISEDATVEITSVVISSSSSESAPAVATASSSSENDSIVATASSSSSEYDPIVAAASSSELPDKEDLAQLD
jgi:hypothetical protein